ARLYNARGTGAAASDSTDSALIGRYAHEPEQCRPAADVRLYPRHREADHFPARALRNAVGTPGCGTSAHRPRLPARAIVAAGRRCRW
nr:hypothetical protein [Tanacetum cinerariifolium]